MSPRRNRRTGRSTLWAAALAAALVHIAVLGSVHALGLSLVSPRAHAAIKKKVVDDVDLMASCAGDVVLATSGRSALCFAPWVASVDDCLADAQMSLWMDLSSCEARNDPKTAIAMVEARTTERLATIDPEKLLEDAARNEAKPPPPPPPPPQQVAAAPPPPPPPPAQQRAQQVIETVRPNDDKTEPENARFLSEFNTRAEKEKVSRGARNEPMVAKAKPESLKATDKPPTEDPSTQHRDERIGQNVRAPDAPGKLSMRSPGAVAPAQTEQEARTRGALDGATGAPSADGYLAKRGEGSVAQDRHDRQDTARGQNGAGGGAPEALLKPSPETLQRALGGGSVDHLENVDDGDETSLNSKKWIYASFFNRLKRQVAQNWDPQSVWRRTDPRGSVYGVKNRFTEVRVSLSKTGELQNILVSEPSGVNALDEEAVRAFKASGPFPNPPEGLIKDNMITFSFGFYFGIGAPRMSWRMPTSM
ncbi:MAG TPA: TonB family protein [Kofleriaceae bacterium]|nr:TonB family protein [Kofleriaceae bacterium]